ncbi:quercetin 2,3-dioxygenase [mine drainage metagenome]|uniref:Quercetin 2,3-dioxygenase n=1 Tax=mine drainage metagenome TaxID=410659 RepID=A0A1J5SGK0_9ZZZZ
MKTTIHKANTRGHANHGWLNSFHTFSFAGYYNAERIHFGALRVLNDDTVKAGMGFGTHPHDNMEIVSIPLFGDLHHKDSTGRDKIIRQHDVQIMSAGSGIQHSETNANHDKDVKFLQIWVLPKKHNIEPRYDQKSFLPEDRINKILTVVAPDDENAIWINQDAWFSLANLSKDFSVDYKIYKKDNGIYAFVIKGDVTINGIALNERDGLGISETDALNITANSDAELLLIDVPMVINNN